MVVVAEADVEEEAEEDVEEEEDHTQFCQDLT